jgi:hypothetical protein
VHSWTPSTFVKIITKEISTEGGSRVSDSLQGEGTNVTNRTLLEWQIHPEFTGFMRDQQAPVAGELKTEVDDNCLDYDYNSGNVYMHPCHVERTSSGISRRLGS